MSGYKSVLTLLILCGSVSANAKTEKSLGLENKEFAIVQERVSVRIEDLPEPVRNSVRSGNYEGWKITDAYRVTREDKSQYYELAISKGEENSKLKVDKNGQTID